MGMPSVDILHQSDCAWLCCLLSQSLTDHTVLQPFGYKFVDNNVDIPSKDLKADFGKEAWIGSSSLLYYFYLCIIAVHTEQAE